jgi:hypothetical protein
MWILTFTLDGWIKTARCLIHSNITELFETKKQAIEALSQFSICYTDPKAVRNVTMLINTGTSEQVGIAGVSIPGRWNIFIFFPPPCRLNLGPTQLFAGDSFRKSKADGASR